MRKMDPQLIREFKLFKKFSNDSQKVISNELEKTLRYRIVQMSQQTRLSNKMLELEMDVCYICFEKMGHNAKKERCLDCKSEYHYGCV